MEGKESQRNPHIVESDPNLEVHEEQAAAAVALPSTTVGALISLCPTPTTSANHPSMYNNSHHSEVRRSTDDREEDLLLGEDHQRQSPTKIDESLYSDDQGGRFAQQPASSGRSNDFLSFSGISTDEMEQSIVEALGNLSLHCPFSPQQECGSRLGDSGYRRKALEKARLPNEGCAGGKSFPNSAQPRLESQIQCDICLFKRRIIARDELEHALYVIALDQRRKVFPKIKRHEALVCHGTEFPIGEEHQTMSKCSLHRHILLSGSLHVSVELVGGQFFSIVSPTTTTAEVSEIRSKGEERIAPGFSVKIVVKCTRGSDELYEDSIRVTLQSGNTILHLIFPIAYYEASVSPWLYDPVSVTPMPEEDREALRSCHVALLDNIGDVISLCEYLYQHKILECDDLDEIRNITRKKDRNAQFLRLIKTRGNILDFVIKLMQAKRENQGAAAILQQTRNQAEARMKNK